MTAEEFVARYAGRRVRIREGSYAGEYLWGKTGVVEGLPSSSMFASASGAVEVLLDESMIGPDRRDFRYFTPDCYEPVIDVLPLPG